MDFIFTFGFTGTGTVSAVNRLGKKNCITFLLFCLRRVTGAVISILIELDEFFFEEYIFAPEI